jgi:hydrogenase maturation factor
VTTAAPARDAASDLAGVALTLARRFAAGATMWCLSPDWPEHAHHVAVEFVHPVIMGKRALPAVAVVDDDPVAFLRVHTRPDDLLVVIGRAAAAVGAVLERARIWGMTSVWIGCGDRPVPGAADHVVWVDGDDPAAPYDGRLTQRYHLLWELTHVCFEHPGLMGGDDRRRDEVCITCSDEACVAEVVDAGASHAVVRHPGGTTTVDMLFVGPVAPGDLVLLHAGTAIARVHADAEGGDRRG